MKGQLARRWPIAARVAGPPRLPASPLPPIPTELPLPPFSITSILILLPGIGVVRRLRARLGATGLGVWRGRLRADQELGRDSDRPQGSALDPHRLGLLRRRRRDLLTLGVNQLAVLGQHR